MRDKAKHAAAQRRFAATPKGRECKRRSDLSTAGKERYRRYDMSPLGKERHRRWINVRTAENNKSTTR